MKLPLPLNPVEMIFSIRSNYGPSLSEIFLSKIETASIHHRNQGQIAMRDPNRDPSCRTIDASAPPNNLIITHEYYDYSGADRIGTSFSRFVHFRS